MRIPPLKTKILLESNHLKSRILVGRLDMKLGAAADAEIDLNRSSEVHK